MVGIQINQVVQVETKEDRNALIERLYLQNSQKQIAAIQKNFDRVPTIFLERHSSNGRKF